MCHALYQAFTLFLQNETQNVNTKTLQIRKVRLRVLKTPELAHTVDEQERQDLNTDLSDIRTRAHNCTVVSLP